MLHYEMTAVSIVTASVKFTISVTIYAFSEYYYNLYRSVLRLRGTLNDMGIFNKIYWWVISAPCVCSLPSSISIFVLSPYGYRMLHYEANWVRNNTSSTVTVLPQHRPNVDNNMVLGVNSRRQVRRGKFGLNQSLIYNPFPTHAQFFYLTICNLLTPQKTS